MTKAENVFGSGGGGKGGKGSSRSPQEAPNTLRSRAKARILDILGEGEIEGPAIGGSWLKSTFLDDVPVVSADGTENFKGVVLHARAGLPDQDYIEGFTAAETPVSVGVEVVHATPVVRRISTAADAVRIILQIPGLSELDAKTGDLTGSRVSIKIEVKADADAGGSSYVTKITDEIVGKTTSPYQRGYRIPLEGASPFDIRVTRLTADSESAALTNQTFWSSYIELVDAKLSHADTALMGLEFDAELFGGSVPRRSYEGFWRKIRIPTNMNGPARTFSGEWAGTFKTEYCNDPAWVAFDLLTNERFGLGEYFQDTDVDKWDFYQASVFNSVQVNDGRGGTEPRFSFNGVISTQEEALSVIDAVVGMMRASLLWDGLGLTIIQDRPTNVSKIFTAANVQRGQFNYVGSSLTARHSVAHVTWFDPANNYEQDIAIIEDQEAILRYGYNVLEVVAYGCTSVGQAHRHGLAMLLSEKLETDALQFLTGIGHSDVRPGEIVEIFDPMFTAQSYGGRVGGILPPDREGTAAITLGAFTVSGTGVLGLLPEVEGEGAASFAAFTVAGTGQVLVSGTAAITLGDFTVSGTIDIMNFRYLADGVSVADALVINLAAGPSDNVVVTDNLTVSLNYIPTALLNAGGLNTFTLNE